jgi:hypothetical protein
MCGLLSAFPATVSPGSPWLFSSPSAKSGHLTCICKAFRRVIEAAGLNPHVVVRHNLRHTAITHLVQAGVDCRLAYRETHQRAQKPFWWSATHTRAVRISRRLPRTVLPGCSVMLFRSERKCPQITFIISHYDIPSSLAIFQMANGLKPHQVRVSRFRVIRSLSRNSRTSWVCTCPRPSMRWYCAATRRARFRRWIAHNGALRRVVSAHESFPTDPPSHRLSHTTTRISRPSTAAPLGV